MTTNYKNLVFQGGGVKGIAYAGAIEVLDEHGLLQNIEKVAGTSAGSIVACLLALRYSATDIKAIVNSTDFSTFEDHKDILRIATKYGLYKGDAFLKWMGSHIENADPVKNGLNPEVKLTAKSTFADFKKAGCRDLHVFSTDLNKKGIAKFAVDQPEFNCDNVIVAEAVRASMSIPMFFMAWKFSNDEPNNHLYVDGGTIYNFPLTAFDVKGPNMETLGFHLDYLSGSHQPNDLGYHHVIKYIEDVFETLLRAQVVDFNNDPEELKRTVKIDDFGIKATDFNLSDEDKTKLYNSGKQYTTEFLAKIKAAT